MLKTSAHEEFAICNALRVAVETYTADAALAARANQPRVAQQFRAQAEVASSILARIEGGQLALPASVLQAALRLVK